MSSASLSASVTRILSLSGFPPELKTKDIQAAFSEWENDHGGFKIKWIDDTALLLVFADPATAKRAYLQTLFSPPAVLVSPAGAYTFQIKPYDGPDAQIVIHAVNTRRGGNNTGNNNTRGTPMGMSVSGSGNAVSLAALQAQAHARNQSFSTGTRGARTNGIHTNGNGISPSNSLSPISPSNSLGFVGREPSPTLPNLPSHPTLNSLISSSLSELSPRSGSDSLSDDPSPPTHLRHIAEEVIMAPKVKTQSTPPKIGDPAKRMVGHALGVKHPGLSSNRGSDGLGDVQNALKALAVGD